MKRLKTRLRRALCACLALAACAALSGCAPLVKDEEISQAFTLYASFYPIYALSALIVDEDIPGMTLHQLVQPQDGCLRSYTLSDWDAYLLMRADAVILGGSGLESFAESLGGLGEDGPAVITATSALKLLGDASDADEAGANHFSGLNPWLFLSVTGAMDITEAICANMVALDAPYEAAYVNNLNDAYVRLEALREEIAQTLSETDLATPVALAHEGLAYFAGDCGLVNCTLLERESGVMPDEQALSEMLGALEEADARAVLLEKQAPMALVRAFENRGYRVALMDTLSTGAADMGADGYFTAMRQNAAAVRDALRGE